MKRIPAIVCFVSLTGAALSADDPLRVYVYLGYLGLFAFDMKGTPVWAQPMEAIHQRRLPSTA